MSTHVFPANFVSFFVKDSCRTILYACEFLPKIRPKYVRKYVYMAYDTTLLMEYDGTVSQGHITYVFPVKLG